MSEEYRRSRVQSAPSDKAADFQALTSLTREISLAEEESVNGAPLTPFELARREIEDAKQNRRSFNRSASPVDILSSASVAQKAASARIGSGIGPNTGIGTGTGTGSGSGFSLVGSLGAVGGAVWGMLKGSLDTTEVDKRRDSPIAEAKNSSQQHRQQASGSSFTFFPSRRPEDSDDLSDGAASDSSEAPDFDRPFSNNSNSLSSQSSPTAPNLTFYANVSAEDIAQAERTRGIAEPGRSKETLSIERSPQKAVLIGRHCESDEEILSAEQIGALQTSLPARWRIFNNWILLYSTRGDGFSLTTLYSRLKGAKGPVILAAIDASNSILGAFASHIFQPHIGHYGTGECFLWRVERKDGTNSNRIVKYPSTGKNNYFLMCEQDFLAIGCGAGKFGLWLDQELLQGTSEPVPTFDNECLADTPEFKCVGVEIWGLDLLGS